MIEAMVEKLLRLPMNERALLPNLISGRILRGIVKFCD